MSRFVFLVLVAGLGSTSPLAAQSQWSPAAGPLTTKWTSQVNPRNAWPEYPRPQLQRDRWLNLNGLWEYSVRDREEAWCQEFDGQILVPFCIESALSGVGRSVGAEQRLWYRRTFSVPSVWNEDRILLHFGAVDWEAHVWVNGQAVGVHRGGYDPFTVDITNALRDTEQQDLVVAVWDPTNAGYQPRGKQVQAPRGIWYTSVTGIWQTVWLEPVPRTSIDRARIEPDFEKGIVRVSVEATDAEYGTKLFVSCSGARDTSGRLKPFPKGAATAQSPARDLVELKLPVRYPWSPETPWLYDLRVELIDDQNQTVDRVDSYFGLRKIDIQDGSGGFRRLFLNNRELFQLGPLDQGWWPDGLYTAPTDEALRYDIEVTKQLGFNMARKHVKVEPARWYYWCDRLGLLVWQDMPNGDKHIGSSEDDLERSAQSARQFERELGALIQGLRNHPAIVVWVPFNEGWGQYDTERITTTVKSADPRRLVINTSGWADRGVGDINDMHAYPGPAMPPVESERAVVLGEFGGLGLPVKGHLWQQDDNWGYRGYSTQSELLEAYTDLFRQLQPFIRKGLASAVYTQTTDVEIEVNGLMTYDRAVVKLPFEVTKKVHAGFLPPIIRSEPPIFLERAKVVIEASGQPGTIRFTTDGSEPTSASEIYSKPIEISETTTIKARTFWSPSEASDATSLTCERAHLRSPQASALSQRRSGLVCRYFEDPDLRWSQIPDLDTLTPKSETIVAQIGTDPAQREQYLAMSFAGFIKVPMDGIYTFYLSSNDGSKLFVDGELVIDHDFSHGMAEKAGQIALSAGVFPLRIEYFQGDGTMGLEWRWQRPDGTKKEIVPSSALGH